jgi:hypothetical protein
MALFGMRHHAFAGEILKFDENFSKILQKNVKKWKMGASNRENGMIRFDLGDKSRDYLNFFQNF